MYNSTTKTYELDIDHFIDNEDPREIVEMSIEAITQWVDDEIETAIDNDEWELEEHLEKEAREWERENEYRSIEGNEWMGDLRDRYPRFGYTSDQVFEDEDAYRAFKRQEMRDAYAAQRDDVINGIIEWAREGVETMRKDDELQDVIDRAEASTDGA